MKHEKLDEIFNGSLPISLGVIIHLTLSSTSLIIKYTMLGPNLHHVLLCLGEDYALDRKRMGSKYGSSSNKEY